MLRYDNYRRPIGLDWTVCNDGNPQPWVWNNSWSPRKTQTNKTRYPTRNPGSGQGSNMRLSMEIEEKMISMYVDQEMAAIAIARELGSTAKTVFRVLKRNDIPTRTKNRAQELRHANARAAKTTWEEMQ